MDFLNLFRRTRHSKDSFLVGDLVSLFEDHSIRIGKILVLERDAVHLRIYKQRFQRRPESIDPTSLSLGSIDDPDGFGVGHLPLSKRAFEAMQPSFLQPSTVDATELEGFRYWKEAGGGLWK